MQVAFEEGKLQNERVEESSPVLPGNIIRTVLLSRDLDLKGECIYLIELSYT